MSSGKRPNIIVILTDDHGYGDMGCAGATDLKTPHLDALAASGVRFTDWYANAPVCSPTRASLLTGRYPGNAGVRSILRGHRTATGLPPHVPTLATVLGRHGYRTAMFGKWHLGLASGCRPNDHGFETFFGHMAGCIDYFSHIFYVYGGHMNPLHDLWENDREVYRNGQYMTDMISDGAAQFIREHAGDDEPFFLYVAYNAPHYPMHAPAKYVDRFKGLPPHRRIMAAMIAAIDDGIGRIVQELERAGVRENTLITFQSDNGPSREARNWLDGTTDPYYGGTAGPFKGHKFSLYEGGVRVPSLMSFPARIPGGRVLPTVGASMDVFPTALAAAGIDPADYELDGVNLLPHLADGRPAPQRDLFFEQGEQTAVRRGNWKLVLNGQLVEGAPPEDAVHLSDLSQDPGESTNLAESRPEITADLKRAAEAWRAGIEARWTREFAPAYAPATSPT